MFDLNFERCKIIRSDFCQQDDLCLPFIPAPSKSISTCIDGKCSLRMWIMTQFRGVSCKYTQLVELKLIWKRNNTWQCLIFHGKITTIEKRTRCKEMISTFGRDDRVQRLVESTCSRHYTFSPIQRVIKKERSNASFFFFRRNAAEWEWRQWRQVIQNFSQTEKLAVRWIFISHSINYVRCSSN